MTDCYEVIDALFQDIDGLCTPCGVFCDADGYFTRSSRLQPTGATQTVMGWGLLSGKADVYELDGGSNWQIMIPRD